MLNSFTAVKTKFIERKSSWIMCTCIELWFLGEKKLGSVRTLFYLPRIEMRKVKRNSPITHWIRQKSKNWILTLNHTPKAYPFMKKTRVQKSHATVPLTGCYL